MRVVIPNHIIYSKITSHLLQLQLFALSLGVLQALNVICRKSVGGLIAKNVNSN